MTQATSKRRGATYELERGYRRMIIPAILAVAIFAIVPLAGMLALLEPPSMPVAIGVLYCDPGSSYEDGVKDHMDEALKHSSGHDINALLRRGHTWTITG